MKEAIFYPAEDDNKACSGLIAGNQTTSDGSVICCYTCDGPCDFRVHVVPAEDHANGSLFRINYAGIPGGMEHTVRADIPEVAHTYRYFSAEVPFGNEKQVFLSENTCSSIPELSDMTEDAALLDWHTLAELTLRRASTASEAVNIMGALVEKYGLHGRAESYLLADPNDQWIIEIVGNSTIWVAVRIPANAALFHANRLRIGEIRTDDPERFRFSPKLFSHAEEKNIWHRDSGIPFHFAKLYANDNEPGSVRREWRAFSMLCPSVVWKNDASDLPLYVIPEIRITPRWVMQTLFRDVMEGTEYSLTEGPLAGPFGCPIRQKVEGFKPAIVNRPIGTWNTVYASVCEARAEYPDELGGIAWFSIDAPRSGTYVPFWCGTEKLPKEWNSGSYLEYTDDSAFWAFQAIDTLSAVRYRDMHADVRKVFDEFEEKELNDQPAIEQKALELYKSYGSKAASKFLTVCTSKYCQDALQIAKDLFRTLLCKYRDGNPEGRINEYWADAYQKEGWVRIPSVPTDNQPDGPAIDSSDNPPVFDS